MLGIIGTGKMGTALIEAYNIKNKFGRNIQTEIKDEIDLVESSEIVFLAVKPKDYKTVLHKIKDSLKNKILIILAAGFSIKNTLDIVGEDIKVCRIMPNISIAVKKGVTAIYMNDNLNDNEKKRIKDLLSNSSKLYEINESEFAPFTAISGSLPAYLYMMIEALSDGAVYEGFNRKISYEIISSSIIGAAELMIEKDMHPGELKDSVSSPSGTTIEAIRFLEKTSFRSSLIEAVINCSKKSRAMEEL